MRRASRLQALGRYVLIGVLTAAPLVITWMIVEFLFRQLSAVGRPWVTAFARAAGPQYPDFAFWIQNESLLSVLAAATIVLMLGLLGWMATRVLGQRLIELFEAAIGKIPFVDAIYRATKRFLTVAGTSPDGQRRVVLINFPSREMRTIGLVTRTLKDQRTNAELVAVYVPTAPNPTSGYIEIVPIQDVTFIDWTFEQAISFIVTGGSNAPDTIAYSGTDRPLSA